MYNCWKKLKTLWQKEKLFCFERFLLLSQCFQKLSAADVSESVYKWERVNQRDTGGQGKCSILLIWAHVWLIVRILPFPHYPCILKMLWHRRKCSYWAISPFASMSSTLFNSSIFYWSFFVHSLPECFQSLLQQICCMWERFAGELS